MSLGYDCMDYSADNCVMDGCVFSVKYIYLFHKNRIKWPMAIVERRLHERKQAFVFLIDE